MHLIGRTLLAHALIAIPSMLCSVAAQYQHDDNLTL